MAKRKLSAATTQVLRPNGLAVEDGSGNGFV